MTLQELLSLPITSEDFKGSQYEGRSWTGKVKTGADLLRQLDSLDSTVGRKGAIVPNKDAGEEEWNKFFSTIAAPDSEYEEIAKPFSEHTRAEMVTAFKKFGLPPKAAKAIAEAAKKSIDENYTKSYSKESFESLLKDSDVKDLPGLTKIVNDVMGKDWLETNTSIPNDAALGMLKFAQGLTTKFGVKTPIEPQGKPSNAHSGEPDAFEAALKAPLSGGIG